MHFASTADYLANPPGTVLAEALSGRVDLGDGEPFAIGAGISATNSWTLFERVLAEQPDLVVEIGMGHGVSALTILAALEHVGNGRLISIDTYDGPFAARLPVAEALIERSGSGGRHEHIRDQSWFGLAELARRGEEPGMVYVDGCHELECVAVDAFLSDQILAVGGILAFNDAGWPSVHSVLQRLVRMDRYDELATGAPRNYRGRNAAYSLVRRLQRRSNEDRHFRKLSHRLPPGPVR